MTVQVHCPTRRLTGLLCLAWLALASLVVAGCGSTVAEKTAEAPAPAAAPSPPAAAEPAPVVEQAAPAPAPTPPPEPTPNLVPPDVRDPAIVALLLPLTGPHAALGQALQDAAFLALSELGEPRLILLPRDTRGTPEGARAAAEQALVDGAELILGPVFRDAVKAAAEPARARGINIIAFSTDNTVAGNGVYLMGFAPEEQVERVLGFAAKSGLSRFAALAPSSLYGRATVQVLERFAGERGLSVTGVEYYSPDGSDADAAVKRLASYEARQDQLKERRRQLRQIGDAQAQRELRQLQKATAYGPLPFDALLIPEGDPVLRAVVPWLPYYDVDGVRFLGTGLWDDPATTREPALQGAWFAAPPPQLSGEFFQRFKAVYGTRPPRIASLAYDAAALAAVLASGDAGPRFDAATLTTASGFAGSDGIFRFHADGTAERGLAVLEVGADGFKVVDPAPTSFEEVILGARPGS